MATAVRPSGTNTQTQVITKKNYPESITISRYGQGRKNNNKVIKSKSFSGIGRRLNNISKQRINKTILKQELLNTYLTFTYEMGPGMEKKIFCLYVFLLLYSYNQIYGSITIKNKLNMFFEQYYSKTNTMNGVVSEDQQKKWANVFMKLLNKMDSSESRQIFTRLQKNISNNIK